MSQVFRPDGTRESPNLPPLAFPEPLPFDLGPLESKALVLAAAGIVPAIGPPPPTPPGNFQVHTTWEAKQATGLNGFSVIVRTGTDGSVNTARIP